VARQRISERSVGSTPEKLCEIRSRGRSDSRGLRFEKLRLLHLQTSQSRRQKRDSAIGLDGDASDPQRAQQVVDFVRSDTRHLGHGIAEQALCVFGGRSVKPLLNAASLLLLILFVINCHRNILSAFLG
jgi:hypothetical protein